MRFLKQTFLIFTVLMLTLSSVQAADTKVKTYKDKNIVGIERTEKGKIRSLLKNLNKYSNSHNVEAIKSFYSKDYENADGFNHEAFFASIKETFSAYPDISYSSKIKSIEVRGDEAAVEMYDVTSSDRRVTTQAIINNKPVLNNNLKGVMSSKCNYVVYLKKESGKWLIYSDSVITEETSIKYGKANKMKLEINSPLNVKEGEPYTISLSVEKEPQNSFVLASLSREEIKYPPIVPFDKYRKVPQSGTVERIVNANKQGINEYSLASIGITEVSINDAKTAINYKMSGMAFLMKRVNVNRTKNAVNYEYLKKVKEREAL